MTTPSPEVLEAYPQRYLDAFDVPGSDVGQVDGRAIQVSFYDSVTLLRAVGLA